MSPFESGIPNRGGAAGEHFDEMAALLFLENQLDAAHAAQVRAHASSCAACAGLLRALDRESIWLSEALSSDEESVPARLVHAPERGSAPWGWIAALGLACGGAYTVWNSFVEPLQSQAAQAGFTQGNILTMFFFSGAFWKGWDAMRTLTEFLGMATLGIILMWLLHRHWRRLTTVAVVMAAMLAALSVAPAASAADVKHGDPNFTLPAGQVVNTDLIVYANSTRIDGDVNGDVIAWSESVTINGHVKGDVLAFGNEVRINGPVDGNVRVCAHMISIESAVARNVMIWAGQIDLDETSSVGGSVTVGADDAILRGRIAGDVLAAGDSIEVFGSLGRDARVHAGRLTIGPAAAIAGSLKYSGRNQPDISSSAKLASQPDVTILKNSHRPDYSSPRYYWHQILFWGARFVFGLAILLIVPGLFFDASAACRRIGPALGFGILFTIATPIVAVLVCITIVGLGVGIAGALLYAIALYSARVFIAAWLGERLMGAAPGIAAAIGRLAVGLAIIQALTMLPFIGFVVAALAAVWGLGGLVLALYKNLHPQWAATA
ncbi:MAG: polymer-forming cytoskeletal protein [Candidatus Acidiferrales bacterium]